ncbi:MAG: DUF2721 domain-containing protein [Verrucomicrobiales bacterium]|nr:DUF2721 domain-containing protein [Verrucomicrobiales bacterium]
MNSLSGVDISTPALLFPAVSLLFLSYTNRFLHLAALIRKLHQDWLERRDETLRAQIENLRKRLVLIRWMQLLGSSSLALCVVSMVSILFDLTTLGVWTFLVALILMGGSLIILVFEIWFSGGALKVLLDRVEEGDN